jgi:hypothetical protein
MNVAAAFGRRQLLIIDALGHTVVHALAGEHPRTNVNDRATGLRHGAGDHFGNRRRNATLVGWIDDPPVNSMGDLVALPAGRC